MPIYDRSPAALTGAEYNVINEETGDLEFKLVQPEDILSGIARGKTVSELMEDLDAPREVVEHAVVMIPTMMSWRQQEESRMSEGGGGSLLPELLDMSGGAG